MSAKSDRSPQPGEFTAIRYEVAGGIATITLNRPDKLNAFTPRMGREIIAAIDLVDADDAVKAVIFTGAGRAYCAGADLSSGASTFDYDAGSGSGAGSESEPGGDATEASSDPRVHRDGGGLVSLRLFDCNKPLIAAINGAAVGVGVTSTLPMDIRIASESARFGFVFARRGIVPEACSSWFLPRLVGVSRALEWCYSGRVFDAAEALDGGLVRSVVPDDELLAAATAVATEIVESSSAVAVTLMRHMMWRMLSADHPMAAHRIDSRGIQSMGASADVREGVESFLEKRPARFSMKPSSDMPDWFPWWDQPEFS